MKKIILFNCVLLLGLYLNAQENVVADQRLLNVFSNEDINLMSSDYPQDIKYLNWYLDNSYTIDMVQPDKYESMPYLKYFDPQTKTEGDYVENIDMDKKDINIYFYSFERLYESTVAYRIGNTGKIITFHSYKTLNDNYNIYTNYEN